MRPRADHQRSDLRTIAEQAMRERGLLAFFEPAVLQQLDGIRGPATARDTSIRDLTALPWASIDNDDSRDLDQLSVAEELPGGRVKVLVAIADVDALVAKGTPIDRHAQHNTTSVYTGAAIFPMLPEKLSTDLTSLNADQDRLAIVMESTVTDGGELVSSSIYRARVQNRSKLAYDSVAAWLDGNGPMPAAMAAAPGVDAQIRLQDRVAQAMRQQRYQHGVLDLETIEARPVWDGESITDLRLERPNRGKQLIEDFMIAANGVTARFLEHAKVPSLRRVVRSPERWARLVTIAAEYGGSLPATPDARALQDFLVQQTRSDPLRFSDLSLVVVKLLGPGEYVVQRPGERPIGHFGLAVRDYTHSTAPNRRYPDLLTHRLLKAALAHEPPPYDAAELDALARHCTDQEDAANKVERQVRKSAAALLLEHRVGEQFDGVITGASEKGIWVRVFHPPVEGKVVHGFGELEVGQKVRVKLTATDVERGFLDFVRIG
jgi:exoribonuclease II